MLQKLVGFEFLQKGIEKTNEENDFAVLQASGSNESCCENFPVKSQIKNVLVHKLVLLWYKTIVL